MANNSLSSIRTTLNTNLDAVTELENVQIGRVTNFSAFPACRHYLLGISDEFMDTADNYRTYRFGIDIIMPTAIEDVSKATSEAAFQDAIDAVMDKLATEWDGAGEQSIIEVGNVNELEDAPFGPALTINIVWQARTLISI